LLFMDVDAVPFGVNFVKVLSEQVDKCDVLLAVIGPNWLNARDEDGNRRLDNPHDFVRIEIGAALQRNIPVIPILLDGAKVPKANQLRKELEELSLRNGLDIRHASFHNDIDRLVRSLKGQLAETDKPRVQSLSRGADDRAIQDTARDETAPSPSAGPDTSGQGRGEPRQQGQAGGAPSWIRQRLSGWLSWGPRNTINGLLVIVCLLGAGVVLKEALKKALAIIATSSVPKDLEADGSTPATMAQRIIDAVTQINRDAAVVKRIGIYTLSEVDPLEPESADYQSPGRGHSLDSAFF